MRARPSLPARPLLGRGIQRKLRVATGLATLSLFTLALTQTGCLTPEREEKKVDTTSPDRFADVPPPGIEVRSSRALGASPVWIVLGSAVDCSAASAALSAVAHLICADARVPAAELEPALRAGLRKLKKEVQSRVTSDPVTVYAAPDALARGRALVASAPGFFARALLWVPPEGLGTLGSSLLGRLGAEGGKVVVLLGIDGDALEPLVRSARRTGLSLLFFSDASKDPTQLFPALRDRYGASILGGAPAPGPSGAPAGQRPAPAPGPSSPAVPSAAR